MGLLHNLIHYYDNKELLEACYEKDFCMAKKAIENGADVNARDAFGNTPLMLAVKYFEGDVPIDPCPEIDIAPPGMVVYKPNKRIVKLLLETGKVKVNAKNKGGETALLILADNYEKEEEGVIDIARMLLEYGADVNVEANVEANVYEAKTPLARAIRRKNEKMVKMFLEAGAKITTEAIILAGSSSNSILKMILEQKIDVNVSDEYGWTPLMEAASCCRTKNVELLIQHGADVNATTIDGETALMIAVKWVFQYPEISVAATVEKLLNAGAKVNIKNKKGETALDILEKYAWKNSFHHTCDKPEKIEKMKEDIEKTRKMLQEKLERENTQSEKIEKNIEEKAKFPPVRGEENKQPLKSFD